MSITMREICQQPEVLERTLRSEKIGVQRVAERVRRGDIRFVILVARGTSDNAALFGRYLLEITTGTPVSLAVPSIHTLYRSRLQLGHTLVVGISQSGEGTEVNVVLESRKRSGAYVPASTNHGQSTRGKTRPREGS
ncbi:MAG: hypothetical protein HXY20_05600 [Acidobacteria bacterium]|nr:hypothetical protein [Acidobacteriota bacterium]